MVVKVVLRAVPTAVTAVMITTAIKAAIRPYSIAVAPDSSLRNFLKIIRDPIFQSPGSYGEGVFRGLNRNNKD